MVGNELPKLTWLMNGNKSFFFDGDVIQYEVAVSDAEDGTVGNGIKKEQVSISIDYLENGYDVAQIELNHQATEVTSQFGHSNCFPLLQRGTEASGS